MRQNITAILLLFLHLTVMGHNTLHNAMSECVCCEYNDPFGQCDCFYCSHHFDDSQMNTNSEHSSHDCNCICCSLNDERYAPSNNTVDVSPISLIPTLFLLEKYINNEELVRSNVTNFRYREIHTCLTCLYYPEAFSLRGPPIV